MAPTKTSIATPILCFLFFSFHPSLFRQHSQQWGPIGTNPTSYLKVTWYPGLPTTKSIGSPGMMIHFGWYSIDQWNDGKQASGDVVRVLNPWFWRSLHCVPVLFLTPMLSKRPCISNNGAVGTTRPAIVKLASVVLLAPNRLCASQLGMVLCLLTAGQRALGLPRRKPRQVGQNTAAYTPET